VLTNRVDAILESRPQFDVRNLMGGTEGLMSDLIHQSTRSPAFFLDSVNCLRMPRASRARVTQVYTYYTAAHRSNVFMMSCDIDIT
jgi:hypothetical protein